MNFSEVVVFRNVYWRLDKYGVVNSLVAHLIQWRYRRGWWYWTRDQHCLTCSCNVLILMSPIWACSTDCGSLLCCLLLIPTTSSSVGGLKQEVPFSFGLYRVLFWRNLVAVWFDLDHLACSDFHALMMLDCSDESKSWRLVASSWEGGGDDSDRDNSGWEKAAAVVVTTTTDIRRRWQRAAGGMRQIRRLCEWMSLPRGHLHSR